MLHRTGDAVSCRQYTHRKGKAHNQRLVPWAYCNLGAPKSSLSVGEHLRCDVLEERRGGEGGVEPKSIFTLVTVTFSHYKIWVRGGGGHLLQVSAVLIPAWPQRTAVWSGGRLGHGRRRRGQTANSSGERLWVDSTAAASREGHTCRSWVPSGGPSPSKRLRNMRFFFFFFCMSLCLCGRGESPRLREGPGVGGTGLRVPHRPAAQGSVSVPTQCNSEGGGGGGLRAGANEGCGGAGLGNRSEVPDPAAARRSEGRTNDGIFL